MSDEINQLLIDTGLFKNHGNCWLVLSCSVSGEEIFFRRKNLSQYRWYKHREFKYLTFEQVLEIIPEDVGIELLFHLDLFT